MTGSGGKDHTRAVLHCYDMCLSAITETLYAHVQLSDTACATLPAEQHRVLVQELCTALRAAIAQHSATPLIAAINNDNTAITTHNLSLNSIQHLLHLMRRSVFAALASCIVQDGEVGMVGLDLIAHLLEQANEQVLHHYIAQQERVITEHRHTLHMFRSLVCTSANGIIITNTAGDIIYANRAFKEQTGYDEDVLTMHFADFIAHADEPIEEITLQFAAHDTWQKILTCRHKDGSSWVGRVAIFPLYHAEYHTIEAQVAIIHNLSDQLQLEDIATPLILLDDEIVAMPLVGAIDAHRAQRIMDTLLEGVAINQASSAILDITGVPVVDELVAALIRDAAQAVRLLGATLIVTGICPAAAVTLVRLQLDMRGIVTHTQFKVGVAYAFAHRTTLHSRKKRRWQVPAF